MTEIPKMGHYLKIFGELNSKPIFEQVTPSRSSGKNFGADLSPPGCWKVQKVLGWKGLKRCNDTQRNNIWLFPMSLKQSKWWVRSHRTCELASLLFELCICWNKFDFWTVFQFHLILSTGCIDRNPTRISIFFIRVCDQVTKLSARLYRNAQL